ncbi:MAG TPA: DUF1064 domain-containing protein [Clostridiaceae bacterium]|nr:DUF1064 domain-containing protein [Clostridiaceae bacterium]
MTRRRYNKYNNVKTVVDGIKFDSKAEAERYQELKLLKIAGEIQGFGLQPSFVLPGGIRYRPDFIVCDSDGEIWVEDVKGVETQAFRIKKKQWDALYSWLPLKVIKRR